MAKILVIEDDSQVRRTIAQILTAAGHEILEANDGQEGLCLFRLHRPVLVITDILMPEKDGLETIRELRGDSSEVAIIAMSGGGSTHSMIFLDVARKMGADLAIAKPFRAPDLLESVNTLLTP